MKTFIGASQVKTLVLGLSMQLQASSTGENKTPFAAGSQKTNSTHCFLFGFYQFFFRFLARFGAPIIEMGPIHEHLFLNQRSKDNIISTGSTSKIHPTKRLGKVDSATRQNHKHILDSGKKEHNITKRVTTGIGHL